MLQANAAIKATHPKNGWIAKAWVMILSHSVIILHLLSKFAYSFLDCYKDYSPALNTLTLLGVIGTIQIRELLTVRQCSFNIFVNEVAGAFYTPPLLLWHFLPHLLPLAVLYFSPRFNPPSLPAFARSALTQSGQCPPRDNFSKGTSRPQRRQYPNPGQNVLGNTITSLFT